MDLTHLKTFLLVAELQGFTAAARRLSFSQSAVSQQIRDLESRLDARLFERGSRSVSLTPAGERLVPLATEILQSVEKAERAMAEFSGLRQGVVTLGATGTLGDFVRAV